MGQLLSVRETHIISSTHYSHNSAPPTTRSDGFLWTITSWCCCNARSSSSNSSSTCCCNTRCCYNTRCCNALHRAKITQVQAVICWRRLPTLQQQQSSSPVRHRCCNVWSEDAPYLSLLHEVAPAVPSAGPTRARTSFVLPASPRRQGVSPVHPQRYQGFDPTFTQDKASYYIVRPRRFARKMRRTNVAVFCG